MPEFIPGMETEYRFDDNGNIVGTMLVNVKLEKEAKEKAAKEKKAKAAEED